MLLEKLDARFLLKGISKCLVHCVKHSFHLTCVTVHHIKMIDPGQHEVMGTNLIIPTCIYSKLCLTLTVKWPSAAARCISNSKRLCELNACASNQSYDMTTSTN